MVTLSARPVRQAGLAKRRFRFANELYHSSETIFFERGFVVEAFRGAIEGDVLLHEIRSECDCERGQNERGRGAAVDVIEKANGKTERLFSTFR